MVVGLVEGLAEVRVGDQGGLGVHLVQDPPDLVGEGVEGEVLLIWQSLN